MFGRLFLAVVITLMHFVIIQPKCSNEAYGLYCTNLTNEEDNENSIVFNTNGSLPNSTIKAIFLKNTTGKIINDSFSLFPQVKSLDIQYCEIEGFSTGLIDLQNLYLMNNRKFPALTTEFLADCCANLKTLYIYDNENLIIENGCFTSFENFNHLTINKQKLQNLSKKFLNGLNEVTYMNLKDNEIESVDGDAFEDMPNLSYLILTNNKITKFEDNTFNKLSGLESFEFLNLDIESYNISNLQNQKELKNIGLPTKLLKQKLQLNDLTSIFRKLETITLSETDKTDEDISNFTLTCEDAGFTVKFE